MFCCCCPWQVDLRGFLGERSWLRPILDALGWVDAYVERMLMAVILVKDEVSRVCLSAQILRGQQRMLQQLMRSSNLCLHVMCLCSCD